MLKADFHMHSMEDPHDVLEHDAFDLIDHAAKLDYSVLSLTLHGRLYCPQELHDYARSKGILLIPGIELYVERREVLVLGITQEEIPGAKTFAGLRALKKRRGDEICIIAPHPFYGLGQCVQEKLLEHADIFDAVEFCHFYTRWWNPNVRGQAVATEIGKPFIACSDTHRLQWMKNHYCLLDAEPTRADVFRAIRNGKFTNFTQPLSHIQVVRRALWHLAWQDMHAAVRKKGWIRQPQESRRLKQKSPV